MPVRPLITPLLALTLCAGCWRVDAPLDPPPAALVEPCARPQGVPLRALSEVEVITPWRRDRTALDNCADRHEALVDWVGRVTGRR